jgi:uncharacterized NAD(P)/FAD-binding protein YdhS
MKSDRRAPVAIIGGGFSGTMVAAQLARREIRSLLVEGGGRLAQGTAFSTDEAAHLLNIPASSMSAWPETPGDFARFVAAEGGSSGDYAQRRRFAGYLGDILDQAVAAGLVEPIAARAVGATRDHDGWRIALADNCMIEAQALVLAIGNQAPEPMRVAEGISPERFIGDPWGPEARAAVERLAQSGGDAFILGTGLTMVDLTLSLDAAGHRGRILALSRRGLIPRAHADYAPAPVELENVPQGNVLALWRWLRRRSAEHGFRAAVDSLRPHSQTLWQELPLPEQRRFLRHAWPWWSVHRHRIAPEVAKRIEEMVREGRLEIVAGRLTKMRETDSGIEAEMVGKSGPARFEAFALGFNCTGPLAQMKRTREPILRQLLDDGEIALGELGIGLKVDSNSRAGIRVWAMGPLAKDRYWEIIAVPDIRDQAAAVAADIETELGQ